MDAALDDVETLDAENTTEALLAWAGAPLDAPPPHALNKIPEATIKPMKQVLANRNNKPIQSSIIIAPQELD
jgi:hypothetical protein